MDDVALNKAFNVGLDRTDDLIELIPEGTDGEAELVGIYISVVLELANRWGCSAKQAVKHVSKVLK